MASLPYPRRPLKSSHRFHRCSQKSQMLTEISGVEEPPTDFTDAHRWLGYVGFSYGIHRIHSKLGCVMGALGTAWVRQDAIPSYKTSVLICAICGRLFSARRFCAFRAFCGRTPFALLVQQRLLHPLSLHLWEALLCKKILCVPCVLWEDTVCLVGAAETAAPPKIASVGGYFMNVGAWVRQDAIPSYDATPRDARR